MGTWDLIGYAKSYFPKPDIELGQVEIISLIFHLKKWNIYVCNETKMKIVDQIFHLPTIISLVQFIEDIRHQT